jgi:hypothetical protein
MFSGFELGIKFFIFWHHKFSRSIFLCPFQHFLADLNLNAPKMYPKKEEQLYKCVLVIVNAKYVLYLNPENKILCYIFLPVFSILPLSWIIL